MSRPIYAIAVEIARDWTKPNYAAAPYLRAMHDLDSIHDKYGMDSARTIVAYFLNNAGQWRGETARRIKAELRAMI